MVARTIVGLSPQSVAAQRTVPSLRTLAISLGQIARTSRSAGKGQSVQVGQTVSEQARVGKLAVSSIVLGATVNLLRFVTRLFGLGEALSAARQHITSGHAVTLVSTQILSATRLFGKPVAAAIASQVLRIVRATATIRLLTTESMIAGRLRLATLAAALGEALTIARGSAHSRLIRVNAPASILFSRVHGLPIAILQAISDVRIRNAVGRIVRASSPQKIVTDLGRFVTSSAASTQFMTKGTTLLRAGGAVISIRAGQAVSLIAGAARRSSPTIRSAQQLILGIAAAVAVVWPVRVALRAGRALRPLYARRRFIKR
jgi:hypothetical protein